MTWPVDEQEQRTAARITSRYPHWLVTWGTHSRLFWAYPRFAAPPGTIITAPGTTELLTLMRNAEVAATPQDTGQNSRPSIQTDASRSPLTWQDSHPEKIMK